MEYGQKFNPYGLFTGLFIPNRIARYKDLSDQSKLLLGRLFQYAGQNGLANPKRATLAKELGWKIRKLDHAIKALKEEGLISTVRDAKEIEEGKPCEYVFLYHKVYDNPNDESKAKEEEGGTVKFDRGGTVKNDRLQEERNNKKKIEDKSSNSSSTNESSLKICSKAKQVYLELIELGATKHREGTKQKTKALETIHRLLKTKCKYPIPKSIAKELYEKKWTIDEIIECFEMYSLHNGKVKDITNFIYASYAKPSFSPLCYSYNKIKKERESRFENLAKLPKRLVTLYIIHFGKIDKYIHQSVFIKTAERLEKLSKTYQGNPSLMHPRNDLVYQFMLYVKEKSNNTNFKIQYMCGKPFFEDFVIDYTKTGAIVKRGNVY